MKDGTFTADRLLALYDRVSEAEDAIPRLRSFVLNLAVRGKLVEHDPADEPAAELLKRIVKEKAQEVRKSKKVSGIAEGPYSLPASWTWTRLGEIGETQTGSTPPKSNPEFYGNDLPFLRPGDLYSTHVDYSGEGLSLAGASASGRLAPAGSILMVCIGTIGKCQLIDRTSSFNQQINALTPLAGLLPSYLLRAVQSDFFQTAAWDASARTTIAILNKGNWEKLPIPLPPLAEQHRIVAKVDELMALCDRLEAVREGREAVRDRLTAATWARLTAPQTDTATFPNHARFALQTLPTLTTRPDQIKTLRRSILNLAVRGKLVEQDPTDEPAAELVKRIAKEKGRLEKEGTSRRDNVDPLAAPGQHAFQIPNSWAWVRSTFPTYGVSDLGKKVQTREVLPVGAFPVVDQGKVLVRGYCDDPEKVVRVTEPMIVFGDHTRETKLIDFDFVVGADGVKLLQPVGVNASYYFLALQWLPLDSRGYGRHFKLLKASALPLPPLAEQHRIVAKVDALMTLCDQLEASLTTATTTRSRLLNALLHEALQDKEAA